MEKQQNVSEFQEKFVIKLDANIAKIVTPFDRRELVSAYLQLFSGFAWVNWTNRHSLGRAWQTALAQCGTFTETKNKNNPAAKYLNNVYGAHKKYWSRVIMTHDGRDNTINPDDKKIKELRTHGEKMIRAAMDKINLILARYNERTEELVAAQAKKKTQMHQAPQPWPAMQAQHAQAAAEQAQNNQPEKLAASAMQNQQKQQNAMPMPIPQVAEQVKATQNEQQNVKSVAQPAQQSSAFAMVRNTVKQPTKAVADKPVEVPGKIHEQDKPQIEQVKKPAPQPIEMKKQEEKPMVHYMAKSVAAPVQKSGALPAVRDIQKQNNVVKSKEIQKIKPLVQFKAAQQRVEINMAQQRAQMQMNFQRQIQMWQFGQFRQNAA